MKIDYSTYSRDELEEAYRSINVSEYPERFAEIKKWIDIRDAEPQPNPNPALRIEGNTRHVCVKCGHENYDIGEFHAAGSWFAKLFDIQSSRFTTVSCRRCNYTEVYRCPKDRISDVLDYFVG
ncbi:zinc ribbon domain-containing protein [Microbulbifer sediminum]|uniref:zinc ribbon domain-containing protein n=1 Tax=Microbulbifer sediminum TaxID=2904250 RepID=UPI001F1CEEC3